MKQCSLVGVIKGKVPVRLTGPLTCSQEGSARAAEMTPSGGVFSLQSHALMSTMVMEVKVTGDVDRVVSYMRS